MLANITNQLNTPTVYNSMRYRIVRPFPGGEFPLLHLWAAKPSEMVLGKLQTG